MFRIGVFALSLFVLMIPMLVSAQGQGGLGLVPSCPVTGCRACDLVVLANRVVEFLIWVGVFVAVLGLAITGFKIVVSGESGAHALGHAFTNVVMGILLMLGAWLIVDTFLKILVNEGKLGPWNKIECIDNPAAEMPATSGGGTTVGRPPTSGSGGRLSQCAEGNVACSVDALQGLGYTREQANVMSCIAMTESSGNPSARSKSSSACGTFQLIRRNWDNASIHGSGCDSSTSCTDARCNALAAKGLMDSQVRAGRSAYSDWTCPGCNAKAQGCIERYRGS